MNFKVLSRNKAKSFSYNQNIDDCVIISITDVYSYPNSFAKNPHIKGVCEVQFNDVDFGDNFCITKKDGEKIIDFVNKYINEVDTIIVHCEAGISRSAGICAALMQIINGDDSPIFDNPNFYPNMSCYRTIMETYYGSYNEKEADKKIAHNIRLWQKENELEI